MLRAGRAAADAIRAWKDNLVFNEYFHGDNGAGLGRHAPDGLDRRRRRPHPRPARRRRLRRRRRSPGLFGGTGRPVSIDRRLDRRSDVRPGTPVPARRDAARRRRQLRRRVERRRRDDAVPVRRRAASRRGSPWSTTTPASGTASSPASGPGRPTATGSLGPYDPRRGVRCNPAKLLLDPYARAITGDGARSGPRCSATTSTTPTGRAPSTRPLTCPAASSSIRPSPGPTAAHRPRRYADTVIYEVHVKGFTMRHPDVPPELRGTYAGLGHEAAIAHLVDLGVTAVELLPVHQNVPEAFLVASGVSPTTGATTRSGSSPPTTATRPRSAPDSPAARSPSSRPWSPACTPPGSRCCSTSCSTTPPRATTSGPTLCHRGLDNPAYYRLDPADPRRYVDTTGCGNAAQRRRPARPAADHGLAALLADRDARRRLPLRPRPDPGPPGRRLRRGVGVLRPRRRRIPSCRRPS